MTAPAATPAALPARVPASTVRAMRRFHALDQVGLASAFQVSVRTVIRWEQRGVDPALLPQDVPARDPKWREKLLFWMLERYRATGSPDNRQEV